MLLANVATPEILTSSSSVCPSTSKLPLASILLVNVTIPVTFKLSSSVCPSTSISTKSPLPTNVTALIVVAVKTPTTNTSLPT